MEAIIITLVHNILISVFKFTSGAQPQNSSKTKFKYQPQVLTNQANVADKKIMIRYYEGPLMKWYHLII